MAQSLYFSRDSKLYVEFSGTLWEIPVLDGFSFSQATNTSDITLNEMQGPDGISRRGRRLFTDSLAPAEWSFSTYVRPYDTGSEHHAVEEALWNIMAGADTYGTFGAGLGIIAEATAAGGADTVDGTYILDSEDGTVSGAGTGASFAYSVDGLTKTLTVLNGGSGFTGSETITFDSDLLEGATSDLVVTVTTLEGGSTEAFYRSTNADANSPYGAVVGLPAADHNAINFGQSNRAVLATCNLYFVMETNPTKPMVYKLENAQINEASIDFEVDGIATINWTGFAKNIIDLQSAGDVFVQAGNSFTGRDVPEVIINSSDDNKLGIATDANTGVMAIDTAVDSTSTFIRNRITQMQVSTTDTTAFPSGEYNLTLTGGNITVTNNITYLVPEELGQVNVPIEGVTGGRTVTGNFTCYLTLDTTGANKGTSVDLFNDMTTVGKGLDKVVNDFQVTFQIGGGVAGTPRLYVTCPKVHIEVPTHSIEDVISVETGFGAYTEDFDKADEFTLTYFGATL